MLDIKNTYNKWRMPSKGLSVYLIPLRKDSVTLKREIEYIHTLLYIFVEYIHTFIYICICVCFNTVFVLVTQRWYKSTQKTWFAFVEKRQLSNNGLSYMCMSGGSRRKGMRYRILNFQILPVKGLLVMNIHVANHNWYQNSY